MLAEPPTQDPDEDDARDASLRRCLVTRESQPKAGLVRFVVGPDGTVLPDLAERLPGRGMWLSAQADVIDTPRGRAALARAARASGPPAPPSRRREGADPADGADGKPVAIRVPDDLAERTRQGLAARIVELLALARRAGQAVSGHDKVAEWLSAGRVGLLVQAADGSAAGRERLARLGGADVRLASPVPAALLGQVFGRDHAVHVAVAPGRLAELIGRECMRLAGLQAAETPASGLQPPAKRPRDGNERTAPRGGLGTDTE